MPPPDRAARILLLATLLSTGLVVGCGSGGGGSVTTSTMAPDRTTAVTVSPTSFEGTTWSLDPGSIASPAPEVTITARFADGTVTGSSGCGTYQGTYTVGGTDDANGTDLAISVDLAATSTTMACPESVMRAEAAYLIALGATSDYRIDGDELTLFSGGDSEQLRTRLLSFEASGG